MGNKITAIWAAAFFIVLNVNVALAQNLPQSGYGPSSPGGLSLSGPTPAVDDCTKFVDATHVASTGAACGGSGSTSGNPTATLSGSFQNGVSPNFMRADGAPKLPATLPALDGSLLTNIDATHLTGTVAAARMPALTGDITTSVGAIATTLATVNVNVGTFGDATHCANFTVNGKGLITAAAQSTSCPGSAPTWPTSGKVVISNGTNSPAGVTEVDGSCLLGVSGAWAAGSCGGASSVSVTAASPNVVITPSPGTGTFTVGTTIPIDASQTGTTPAISASYAGGLTILGNASSVAASIAQAGTTGFENGKSFGVINNGAGLVTLTATTSVFKGAGGTTTLTIPQNTACWFNSDGTNYIAEGCTAYLPAAAIRGTVAVANGGTGITSLGTGVATALGANVSGTGAICLASGSACSGAGSNITIGTTTITSGTTARVLYDNAGVAGELTTVPVAQGGTNLASGTSGGVLCYTASGTLASSSALTANLPVIGGGAGVCPAVGTRSGNTTAYVTTTGSQTSGDCVSIDASGNHIPNGAGCVSLSAANNWLAEQRNCITTLSINNTTHFTPDGSCNNYIIVLTSACASAACTLDNWSTTRAGASGWIKVVQPASGGPAAFGTYGSQLQSPGTTSTITYSTAANAVDLWSYANLSTTVTAIVPGGLAFAH